MRHHFCFLKGIELVVQDFPISLHMACVRKGCIQEWETSWVLWLGEVYLDTQMWSEGDSHEGWCKHDPLCSLCLEVAAGTFGAGCCLAPGESDSAFVVRHTCPVPSFQGALNYTHSALSPCRIPSASLLWLIRAIRVDFLIYLINGEGPSSSREGRRLLKTLTPSSLASFH